MRWFGYFCCCAVLSILVGCAGDRYHRSGMEKFAEGSYEEAIASLEKAVQEDPNNVEYKADLLMRRFEYINSLLISADSELIAGNLERAEENYKKVLEHETGNFRAKAGLAAVERNKRHVDIVKKASEALKKGDVELSASLIKTVLIENPANRAAKELSHKIETLINQEALKAPKLKTNQQKPINMEFHNASLKLVLEALARTTSVNFIFDKDVRSDLRVTIFLRQASLEDAIELILQTNRLKKKVLNRNTILIYPNTPEKLKEYQELIVKGFYLDSADAKQTMAMLKGLLKAKDVFVNEKLNLLVMRDTPSAIKLAEKLIAMHDIAEPEVMLEVELIEIKRTRLLELGIQPPNKLTLTPLASSGSTVTLENLKNISSNRVAATLPSTVVNLRRDVSDVNILANPRIRARNREKAKIMIGDKVPVSNSTTTSTGVVSESVQYLDVGITLEVEPNVYLDNEVAIKLGMEVSSITNEVTTPGGSLAYQLGSRSASTVLRLKDGETQVLAGLISEEDRKSASRLPGLGDIPLLGRLFGSHKDDGQKTEIILAITPHLIRNVNRPDASISEFWSGTEATLRTHPMTLKRLKEKSANKNNHNDSGGAQDETIGLKAPTNINLAWRGPEQVKVGETFELALRMKADGGVRSFPFQLAYDSSAIQIMEAKEGGFFKQNRMGTSFSKKIDSANGKFYASVVRSGTSGASGEGDVIILSLKALTPKKAAFNILSATPISTGGKTIEPTSPGPYAVELIN